MLKNRTIDSIATFLVTAMAISFASPSFANDPVPTSGPISGICTTASPNGGRINIRSGAGKNFRVVGTVASRANIDVSAFQNDAEGAVWYRVRVGRINGWILSSFISCISP
jgi:uncharacterized protein YgiM (DUF1202 family)